MRSLLSFLLILVTFLISSMHFMFQIKQNLWYLVPFAGSCLGTVLAVKFGIFFSKNLDKIDAIVNSIANISYLIGKRSRAGDADKMEEFTKIITMEPSEFKKKY